MKHEYMLRDITAKLLHLHVPGLAIDPIPSPSFKSPEYHVYLYTSKFTLCQDI